MQLARLAADVASRFSLRCTLYKTRGNPARKNLEDSPRGRGPGGEDGSRLGPDTARNPPRPRARRDRRAVPLIANINLGHELVSPWPENRGPACGMSRGPFGMVRRWGSRSQIAASSRCRELTNT